MNKSFVRSCENMGFQIRFSNGYMISVQFGTFSDCSRKSFDCSRIGEERTMEMVESSDAEVAIFYDSEFLENAKLEKLLDEAGLELSGDGMVCGWVSADDIGRLIGYLATKE